MLRYLDKLVELLLFIDSSQDLRKSIFTSTAGALFFIRVVVPIGKLLIQKISI